MLPYGRLGGGGGKGGEESPKRHPDISKALPSHP
jgi:hypothetical protein